MRMIVTICCSPSLIASYLIQKSGIGKLRKLCIAFQYMMMIRMLDCEIETEMVVGWFVEEL